MFSISTVWNAQRHEKAGTMVAELRGLGFERLELSCGLPAAMVRDVTDLVNAGRVGVSSLHNYCPAPLLTGVSKMSHSLLPLSSRDERVRKWAVRQTLRTLESARLVGASVVVLHLGSVPLRPLSLRLIALAENGHLQSRKYEKLKEKLRAKREGRKGWYLEQAVRSLESIARYAEELNVKVGIENRYYPEEIPSLDEIGLFLGECASPAVGYWHDVGHAQVRENLGWEEHGEYLKRYGDRLVGMHIHDVVVSRDHRAPLQGAFDFAALREYLRKDVIKVLEIHPAATAEEIKQALVYLRGLARRG